VSPVITGKVSKIRCSVNWKDQGWGNQKGQLKLSLMRNGKEINAVPMGTAPHAMN